VALVALVALAVTGLNGQAIVEWRLDLPHSIRHSI
jgi:hypothetical protein